MAKKVINLLEAQEKKSRQYYINDTRQRTEPFESLFSERQTIRRKLDKLFVEWFPVLGIVFVIIYPILKNPKNQTSDIVQIVIALLLGIGYTIWVFSRRKKLKEKLEKI